MLRFDTSIIQSECNRFAVRPILPQCVLYFGIGFFAFNIREVRTKTFPTTPPKKPLKDY
jgi:hypothetical protein